MPSFTIFVSDEIMDALALLFGGLVKKKKRVTRRDLGPFNTNGSDGPSDSRLALPMTEEEKKEALYNRWLNGHKKRHPDAECFWGAYDLEPYSALWQFARMVRAREEAARFANANPVEMANHVPRILFLNDVGQPARIANDPHPGQRDEEDDEEDEMDWLPSHLLPWV